MFYNNLTKIVFTFLALLSTFSFTFAQDEENIYNRSFGVDASFINNFIPLEGNIGFRGPHLFHFIKYKENDKLTRHAFDLNLSGALFRSDREANTNDYSIDIEYKLGKGKRRNVFKKGYLLYGWEAQFRYSNDIRKNPETTSINETDFFTRKDQIFAFAFGPFLGLEYKFNQRFSLYVEGGISGRVVYFLDSFMSDSDPNINFMEKRFSFNDVYSLPSSLILFYSF